MEHKIAARVVVRDKQGRFLLVHTTKKNRNRWEFPGGALDISELPAEAAKRELFEEVGLHVGDMAYIRNEVLPVDGAIWTCHFFLALQWSGVPENREPSKADGMGFKTVEEMGSLECLPAACIDIARSILKYETQYDHRKAYYLNAHH